MKIILNNIKKEYEGKQVLNINELEFNEGKIYGILGANGSGKSTLLDILALQDKAYTGELELTDGSQPQDISYMQQKSYIFDISVLDNVLLGIRRTGLNKKQMESAAMEALENVGMTSFANKNATKLSGGEAQRVALARTLILNKKIVILDEPASAVDITNTDLIEKYIKNSNKENNNILILSTHNPAQAHRICDEIIYLKDGIIIEKSNVEDFFNNPKEKDSKIFLEYYTGMKR